MATFNQIPPGVVVSLLGINSMQLKCKQVWLSSPWVTQEETSMPGFIGVTEADVMDIDTRLFFRLTSPGIAVYFYRESQLKSLAIYFLNALVVTIPLLGTAKTGKTNRDHLASV